jgi:hypothetical protein
MSMMGQAGGFINLGPYKYLKCPACGKRSIFNIYSSAKDPVTWPKPEQTQEEAQPAISEEEAERKKLEDSKYERSGT